MKRIEITTSHNIIVRFELASFVIRIGAFIIDILILMFFSFLFSLAFGDVSSLSVFVLILVWALYHLVFEVFNQGQSPGKMLLKIRVVSLEGRTPTFNDYLTRWAFRMIDVLPTSGSVAILLISSSEKNQRLGDMLANTTVVKVQNENAINLSSIQNIESEGEMLYPGIAQFSDGDMLLVKEAINRYMKNPHKENKSVITQLTRKITERLQIKPPGGNTIDFLKRALYEYVLLTR